MIYVCVPVHNEARTAGLVLWKVRQVFTAFSREYTLLVCDDGSTDETSEVLARYSGVLPLVVVTHRERRGYARSLEELLRLALQRTDRPKRDCAITLHADFVHNPEVMEEMVKRLESGADLVVAEETGGGALPASHRWARRWAPRLLRVAGVRDALSGFLALRLITLRQALKGSSEAAFLTTDGWCANAELVARLAPQARRVDTVPSPGRYDLRQRPSRVRPLDALVAAWRARGAIRAARTAAVLFAALVLGAASPGAQTDTPPPAIQPAPLPVALAPAVPFPVGERMTFQAKYGLFNVGHATLEVVGLDTVRGTETVRLRFHLQGSALWYDLDQQLESWVGRADFRSRRYRRETLENQRQRTSQFDIFPDSGYYRELGRDTTFATIADPLDDAAFFYWVRTTPLELRKRYEYHRYFRPDRNPAILEVIKRERINTAGRKWNALVVRVIIPRGRGIFAERSDTRLWLSDDAKRVVLALQSSFSFGTVTLKLKEYHAAEPS
jgi:dolichol-phosphate mannosyltransferase